MSKNFNYRTILILVVSIFLCELLIMTVLNHLNIPSIYLPIIDSIALILCIYPSIYYFVIRPMTIQNKKINESGKIISKKNTELLKLIDDKDKFMSILAHDLKNPLGSFVGLLKLLYDNIYQYDIEKVKNLLNHINIISQSTYNLLDDLLMWNRSQSNELRYTPIDFNVCEICEDILLDMSYLLSGKNITTNKSLPENTIIYGDINMIKTIIRNLITNAIKFTNKGGEISINVENTETDTVIIISDNGVGMSDDILKNLFIVSNTTKGTNSESGTGLGLLLVKNFIDKHNGKIEVESKENEGSKFKITLPYKNI